MEQQERWHGTVDFAERDIAQPLNAIKQSWLLEYDDDHDKLARRLRQLIDRGDGVAIIRNIPIAALSPRQVQDFAPDVLRLFGQPLWQGQLGSQTLGWLVRNEGVRRFREDSKRCYRSGIYTSKSSDELDLHNDAAMQAYGNDPDYFALLAYRQSKQGGESILVSSYEVYQLIKSECPRVLERLLQPFAFERQHVVHPGQPPVSWGPIFRWTAAGKLRVRWNRQRIEMAPELTGKPLTEIDLEALDLFDDISSRPHLQFRHTLKPGECLVVDDHAILHGRAAFVDGEDDNQRRCLVRVLLRQHEA